MESIDHLLGKVHNCDCLEFMRQLPDKCVDLVLTDPPYGINYGAQLKGKGDGRGGADKNGWKSYDCPEWDTSRPSPEIFKHIIRIGKNAIIWGGNYFADLLPASQKWMVWDKGQRDFSLADGELAWTSYDKAMRIFTYSRGAALQDGKQHPTQKPEALMRWCIDEAMGTGNVERGIIFDPFMGSGTTAVACERRGFQWFGCELEPKYVAIANKRIEAERNQLKLF